MKFQKRALAAVIAATLTGAGASTAVAQPNPYLQPDNSWISISGSVADVTRDSFNLDYGEGEVIVEMDDGDRDADAYKLIDGDSVTVTGVIDDDFFETTSIEAASVYVDKLGTHFYASALDEEDHAAWFTTPAEPGQVTLQGTVTETHNDGFVLNEGLQSVSVGVDEMAYNPMDNEGYLKVEKGDKVRVTGIMDNELMDDEFIDARALITLAN
jgi:uncharacterized protein YdeI (BOF family)